MAAGPDGLVTVYGRMPVLEALRDDRVRVERVLLSRTARGESVDAIAREAARRRVRLTRVAPEKVTRVSGNGRHDQGVVADVAAPRMAALDQWLAEHPDGPAAVVLLDGVTNPANVGMIVRTVVAAGLDALVLPRAGSPDVGPLVVKASAGVALDAPILRTTTARGAAEELVAAGFAVYGLWGRDARPLWSAELADRAAYVLGNETSGVSAAVAELAAGWLSIPLAGDVESLNVASAAAVLAFELARRRHAGA